MAEEYEGMLITLEDEDGVELSLIHISTGSGPISQSWRM